MLFVVLVHDILWLKRVGCCPYAVASLFVSRAQVFLFNINVRNAAVCYAQTHAYRPKTGIRTLGLCNQYLLHYLCVLLVLWSPRLTL